jgi:hypothetical protein
VFGVVGYEPEQSVPLSGSAELLCSLDDVGSLVFGVPSRGRAKGFERSIRCCTSLIRRIRPRSAGKPVNPDGADVFVQHVRLDPNVTTGWHTHPGPAIVTVVKGLVTYEDAHAGSCHDAAYEAGHGFVDPGFGHVHRAIAGPEGVDFYVVYVLPPGSPTHVIPTDPIPECSS